MEITKEEAEEIIRMAGQIAGEFPMHSGYEDMRKLCDRVMSEYPDLEAAFLRRALAEIPSEHR